MKKFWNERYNNEVYIYGVLPNAFFKTELCKLKPGKILVPGAGEGRDAVFAAKNGWLVDAFDYSEKGKEKALKLAEENHVTISYSVADAADFECKAYEYDAVVLTFFHLPEAVRKTLYQKIRDCLKPGGVVIMEAFTPKQLKNTSGGPKEIELLTTSSQLSEDFSDFQILDNEEVEIQLDEGSFHKGKADVVRFVARKRNSAASV